MQWGIWLRILQKFQGQSVEDDWEFWQSYRRRSRYFGWSIESWESIWRNYKQWRWCHYLYVKIWRFWRIQKISNHLFWRNVAWRSKNWHLTNWRDYFINSSWLLGQTRRVGKDSCRSFNYWCITINEKSRRTLKSF